MPQEKLDLFQLASGLMAKTGTGSTKIMRCDYSDSALRSRFANDRPDHFRSNTSTVNFAILADGAKERPALQPSRPYPHVDSEFHPTRHWHSPHVTALADEIWQHPMFLPKLEVFCLHCHNLRPSQTAAKEHGQDGTVAYVSKGGTRRSSKQLLALLNGQPVADSNTESLGSLNPTNSGSEVRAKKTAVRSLIRESAYGSEP